MTDKHLLLPSSALNEAFETESAVSDTSDTPMTNNFEIPQIQIPQDSQINLCHRLFTLRKLCPQ